MQVKHVVKNIKTLLDDELLTHDELKEGIKNELWKLEIDGSLMNCNILPPEKNQANLS